jgi:aryl carrier-like protein
MLPHRIAVRRDLPRCPSGKVDRLALSRASEELGAGTTVSRRLVPDDGALELERTIRDIWRELLGREGESDANFFDAGGDSLRLLAMHARLRERLHVDISVTDVFAHGTIRKLAALVAGSQAHA